MTDAEQTEFVVRKVREIAEHFDCVTIMCSTHNSDAEGTQFIVKGSGNLFARRDLAREWLEDQAEDIRARRRQRFREELEDDDDDPEFPDCGAEI